MANQRKRKTTQKRNNKKSNNSFVMNKQLSAIIIFAVGILWFCMALIDAQGLWGGLRTFLFGVFGVFTCNYELDFNHNQYLYGICSRPWKYVRKRRKREFSQDIQSLRICKHLRNVCVVRYRYCYNDAVC